MFCDRHCAHDSFQMEAVGMEHMIVTVGKYLMGSRSLVSCFVVWFHLGAAGVHTATNLFNKFVCVCVFSCSVSLYNDRLVEPGLFLGFAISNMREGSAHVRSCSAAHIVSDFCLCDSHSSLGSVFLTGLLVRSAACKKKKKKKKKKKPFKAVSKT